MRISIAMCTYNGAGFVTEQLKSIAAQTRLPEELVIFDDASTDKTLDIVETFAQSAPMAVSVHANSENVGSTANFERAIRATTGDIVFLADQDDVWQTHKVERLASILENEPELGLVFTDADIIDEDGNPTGGTLWEVAFPETTRQEVGRKTIFDLLIRRDMVTGATVAFRSSLRDRFLPIPTEIPNLIHDGWIALIAAAAGEIRFLNEPLIQYRQHKRQQCGVDTPFERKGKESRKDYEKWIEVLERENERLAIIRVLVKEHPVLSRGRLSEPVDAILVRNEERRRHLKARIDYPRSPIRRLPEILRELTSGRYRRHSRGLLSAAKDLIAPNH